MAAQLTIDVVPGADEALLRLDGEVDLSSVPTLRSTFELVDTAVRRVTMDLGGVTFLDSTGVHEILRMSTRCEREGRTLRIVSPTDQVRRVFEMTGVGELLSS